MNQEGRAPRRRGERSLEGQVLSFPFTGSWIPELSADEGSKESWWEGLLLAAAQLSSLLWVVQAPSLCGQRPNPCWSCWPGEKGASWQKGRTPGLLSPFSICGDLPDPQLSPVLKDLKEKRARPGEGGGPKSSLL